MRFVQLPTVGGHQDVNPEQVALIQPVNAEMCKIFVCGSWVDIYESRDHVRESLLAASHEPPFDIVRGQQAAETAARGERAAGRLAGTTGRARKKAGKTPAKSSGGS